MAFIDHHQHEGVRNSSDIPRGWVIIGLAALAWVPVLGFLAIIS